MLIVARLLRLLSQEEPVLILNKQKKRQRWKKKKKTEDKFSWPSDHWQVNVMGKEKEENKI